MKSIFIENYFNHSSIEGTRKIESRTFYKGSRVEYAAIAQHREIMVQYPSKKQIADIFYNLADATHNCSLSILEITENGVTEYLNCEPW